MNNQHRRGMPADRDAALAWLNLHAKRIASASDEAMLDKLKFVGTTELPLMQQRGFIEEHELSAWDTTFRVVEKRRKGELGIVERASA